MNKVILKGRLTKDPEVMYTNGDDPMCLAKFTIAVDDRERAKDEGGNYHANFIPCVCMGRLAETAEANLCKGKGKELLICGKMQSGSYLNKEGRKIYTLECFVKEIEYCKKKADTPMHDAPFMHIPEGNDEFPFN